MEAPLPSVEAEIAAILREAKSMSYHARSVLTVARHRVAVAAGRKVRTPTSDVTRLYLDALEGRDGLGRGIAAARLRQMVERLEALLRRQTDDTAARAILVGDIPEGDDILQCDIPAAAEPALVQVERVVLRGTVRVLGNVYTNCIALAPRHGERVQVSYNTADTAKVSVKDMNGSPICEAAKFQVNAVPMALDPDGHLRKPDLTGIDCFCGFSGYGKTIAPTFAGR
ncbi:MAG: Mu transposase C-terminal domain-containing protein [Magnetospirillum sp.]|nr:Mu transposase C-terminal domain-containing protein [Magnetospirillum sp.]